jgi:hypothetical protein
MSAVVGGGHRLFARTDAAVRSAAVQHLPVAVRQHEHHLGRLSRAAGRGSARRRAGGDDAAAKARGAVDPVAIRIGDKLTC